MYSSLSNTKGLTRISRIKALCLYFAGYKFSMIVRNPANRAISFFKNKFRNTDNLDQVSLHLFYPYLKGATKKEKRLKASLNDFVDILPMVYQKDGHLFPQHLNKGFYIKNLKLFIPFNNVKMYKMETDVHQLEIDFGLRFPHKNKTVAAPDKLSDLSISIIETLYKKDYELFNYDRVFKRPLDSHGMAFIRH